MANLKRDPPASASGVLGLKVDVTKHNAFANVLQEISSPNGIAAGGGQGQLFHVPIFFFVKSLTF